MSMFWTQVETSMGQCLPSIDARQFLAARTLDLVNSCYDLPSSEDRFLCLKGQEFFFQKTLSKDHSLSCSDCHQPSEDGGRIPILKARQHGWQTSPNLMDIGRRERPFFWNGRARTLEGSIFWPLYHKDEMGHSPESLESRGGASFVVKALASFLRKRTGDLGSFDHYLSGDCFALSTQQTEGLKAFINSGCDYCHRGAEFTDNRTHKLVYYDLPNSYFQQGEARYLADYQRFSKPSDSISLKTKTPTLRNLTHAKEWGRFGFRGNLSTYIHSHSQQVGLTRSVNSEAISSFIREAL